MVHFSIAINSSHSMIPQACHNLLQTFHRGEKTMPKNKIQFHKGLILNRFLELYGTEEQCRERLFKARWPDGYKCPKCGYTNYYVVSTRGLYQCCNCRYQCSITSDTIFACSKLPLRTWFLGIFFITQSKEGISALNLRRLLGISVNAAMKMKHKLQQ